MLRRGKGEGWIRKKPRGGWYAGLAVRGQRVSVAVSRHLGIPAAKQTRADARRLLEQLKAHHGAFVRQRTISATVSEILDDYMRTLTINVGSHLSTYRSREKHMKEAFGDLMADAVSTSMLLRWAETAKANGYAAASIRDIEGHLRSAMRYAMRQSPPKMTQVPLFPMIKVDNARQAMIEGDQFVAIHPHLPDPLRWAVELAYVIGWRRGELFTLTWPMVSWESMVITIPKSKNRDARMIPISPEIEAILRQAWKVRRFGCAWVFHREGAPLKGSWAERSWKRACQEAKITDRKFHDLRRSGVQRMVHNGVPDKVAMDISGHKTTAMLHRYAIKSMSSMAAALALPALPKAIRAGLSAVPDSRYSVATAGTTEHEKQGLG